MKILSIILMIAGAIGTIYFGYNALDQSKSVHVMGADVAVSSANWTPVILSAVAFIVGIILRAYAAKGIQK